jgi:glutathione synthase/RimK-type ligase-like ATP-grasp enzyme
MSSILVLTRPEDAHIPYVTKHLAGENVITINPSDMIDGVTIDYVFSGGKLQVLHKDRLLPPIKSIWIRRPTPLEERILPVTARHKEYVTNALQMHAQMLVDAFPGALWFSDTNRIFAAENKLLQMQLAAKLGLQVPETLFASSAEQAEKFVAKYKVCIAKTQATKFPPNSMTMTRIIRPSDKLNYRNINLDPYIFQPYIEPAYELRVTVVGNKVFAAKVEGQETDGISSTYRDWRYAHVNDTFNATRATLPKEAADACRQLVRELSLEFGAIDLIVDKQNTIWFLEINPNGQWAFVEQYTKQPIGKAIADRLKAGAARPAV